MIRVPFGQSLPLHLVVPDGDDSLFPRVTIYDMYMVQLAGPITLQSVGGGVYAGTWTTPNQGQFRAVYTTWKDAGGTTPSKWGRSEDTFDVNSSYQDISTIKDNVGGNSGRAR